MSFHALLQGIFPTQGSDLGLPHCRWIVYHLSHQGSSENLEEIVKSYFTIIYYSRLRDLLNLESEFHFGTREVSLPKNDTTYTPASFKVMVKRGVTPWYLSEIVCTWESSINKVNIKLLIIIVSLWRKKKAQNKVEDLPIIWWSPTTTDLPYRSDGKESACNAGDPGSTPGLGRSSGEGNGNSLQYSCLENPMDRGTWWAAVQGVTKSWTRLNDYYYYPHLNNSVLFLVCLILPFITMAIHWNFLKNYFLLFSDLISH